MFEIGSSLRDARLRQKLELSQAEAATRIRAKYLAALEDERFELLPHSAYARAFLSTYATYLGLDPRLVLDEYDSRFPPPEEVAITPPRTVARPSRFGRRLLLVPAAAIVGVVVWQAVTAGGGRHAEFRPPPARTHVTTQTSTAPRTNARQKPTPRTLKLRLVAARGRSWLEARLGSAHGRVVYEQTLEVGQSVRFGGHRLWIRVGAPWNLDAWLNGKRVGLPGSIANVVVTPAGLHIA